MPGRRRSRTKPSLPVWYNYHSLWKSTTHLNAKPVKPGQLEGPLGTIAVYCLISCNRRVGQLNDTRLLELYMKQCPGLLSVPDPRRPDFMRVRRKPFQAWLLRNIDRVTMTKSDLRAEESRRFNALLHDYMENGPHFHNPAHRQAWEESRLPC